VPTFEGKTRDDAQPMPEIAAREVSRKTSGIKQKCGPEPARISSFQKG
jgi:hypothetical protein